MVSIRKDMDFPLIKNVGHFPKGGQTEDCVAFAGLVVDQRLHGPTMCAGAREQFLVEERGHSESRV